MPISLYGDIEATLVYAAYQLVLHQSKVVCVLVIGVNAQRV